MRLGGIEAGGTKMVCCVGDENGQIFDRQIFPTLTPEETLPVMIEYFEGQGIEALGIGCFGPVEVRPTAPRFGEILHTPKLAWRGVNMVKAFQEALHIPVGLDTDVNAALLGEQTFGVAKGLQNAIYITIGTGIGAGILCEGHMVHGALHPEAGHILLQRRPGDTAKSSCPCHDHCFEGLASGPAIQLAFGQPAGALLDEPAVWEREADYVGQAITGYICMLAPEKIILGGGVMNVPGLIERIRAAVLAHINGYLALEPMEQMDDYIVLPGCGGDQGILGALVLAKRVKVA